MRLKNKVRAKVIWTKSLDPLQIGDLVEISHISRKTYKINVRNVLPNDNWFVLHYQLEPLERKVNILTLRTLICLLYEYKSFDI